MQWQQSWWQGEGWKLSAISTTGSSLIPYFNYFSLKFQLETRNEQNAPLLGKRSGKKKSQIDHRAQHYQDHVQMMQMDQ